MSRVWLVYWINVGHIGRWVWDAILYIPSPNVRIKIEMLKVFIFFIISTKIMNCFYMAKTKPNKTNASICVRFMNNSSGKKRFFINIDVFKGRLISEDIFPFHLDLQLKVTKFRNVFLVSSNSSKKRTKTIRLEVKIFKEKNPENLGMKTWTHFEVYILK